MTANDVELPFCVGNAGPQGVMALPSCEEALEMLKAYRDDPLGTLKRVLLCLEERGDLPAA